MSTKHSNKEKTSSFLFQRKRVKFSITKTNKQTNIATITSKHNYCNCNLQISTIFPMLVWNSIVSREKKNCAKQLWYTYASISAFNEITKHYASYIFIPHFWLFCFLSIFSTNNECVWLPYVWRWIQRIFSINYVVFYGWKCVFVEYSPTRYF